MYDVLLCVDEHESRSLEQARAVVDLPGDPGSINVHVFHSFEDNPAGATIMQFGPARRARNLLEDEGLNVTMEESSGPPAERILERAEELNVNMICLSGRKRTPVGKILFGSVTQAVLLEADQPVLTCGITPVE